MGWKKWPIWVAMGWLVMGLPLVAKPNPEVPSAGSSTEVPTEVPTEVLRAAQEAIEPVFPGQRPATVPVLMNRTEAQQAAIALILRARQLLDAPGERPSILEINAALAAYNHLIVLLGLTDPAQLTYFPRIQAIGLALAEIREQNAKP